MTDYRHCEHCSPQCYADADGNFDHLIGGGGVPPAPWLDGDCPACAERDAILAMIEMDVDRRGRERRELLTWITSPSEQIERRIEHLRRSENLLRDLAGAIRRGEHEEGNDD